MTIRKNITVTEQHQAWVTARIDSGDYANESEYFRDLIRRDQQESARLKALQEAIDEGLRSGVYAGDVNEAIAAIREKLGLRPRNA